MRYEIDAGTRLKKADSPGYTLEVLELFTPADGLPHARTRVRILSYDLGVRLYSISALKDARLFVPAGDLDL